ncbi:similar to Saccharomyces cerevisiae YBR008C FLR1 Plasma membrane multidrug transporter of the major facilitator superfamily [Maudiozyma barnettii]|nr:similar to Saccharomyces cerevisiae YBR008C FLR1 Plasma membrane multidrug transporter of the major facilitator superfamily [Kazachstania barnettii]
MNYYLKHYKNSFFTDILEFLNIVTIQEQLPHQTSYSEKKELTQSIGNIKSNSSNIDNVSTDISESDDITQDIYDNLGGDDQSYHNNLERIATVMSGTSSHMNNTNDKDNDISGGKPGKTHEEKNDIDADDEEKQLSGTDSNSTSQSQPHMSNLVDDGDVDENDIDDPFLISWHNTSMEDNPLNWSTFKKSFMMAEVMLLGCVTYMCSSIYTPAQATIAEEFGTGHVVATLNLSLYALGYGIGPIIFSPLSEVAKIGRQQIYFYTLFVFFLFQIGCATVKNMGGLIVLRFFAGIMCSPALATGGATVADMVTLKHLSICLSTWDLGATCAPIIAPIIGAAMLVAKDWRWIFWFMTMIGGFTLVLLLFFFPETSHQNILARRAKRLRKQTGDQRYYTRQERLDSKLTKREIMITTLYRPWELMFKEPIIMAFDLYIALAYGAFYLFFEAFPLVFTNIWHFTVIESGLAFLGFAVGTAFSYPLLFYFLKTIINPKIKTNTVTPEMFLILMMWVGWCLPLGLFLFGWGAGTHWIVPIISEIFFQLSLWSLFQVTYSYLASCYPRYVASVFAGNGLVRSIFACAFPLFGVIMYENTGTKNYPVGWGSSILGFFTLLLTAIPFILYKYGPAIRARSKFSG